MKTAVAILCVVLGFIALPITIVNIIDNDRILFNSFCIFLILPGFVSATHFLSQKYDW